MRAAPSLPSAPGSSDRPEVLERGRACDECSTLGLDLEDPIENETRDAPFVDIGVRRSRARVAERREECGRIGVDDLHPAVTTAKEPGEGAAGPNVADHR